MAPLCVDSHKRKAQRVNGLCFNTQYL